MDDMVTITSTGNETTGYLSVEKEDFALHSIAGIEIFSTGKWNGSDITEEDLDSIVKAYEDVGFKLKPFLKLGHTEDQRLIQDDGLPAAGWIGSLKKVGNKLIADFIDIPQKIYELLKNGAYKKVSCEIYHNIEIEGKKYPRLLGAVALLGANMPAVMNLDDILALYTNMGLKAYPNRCNLKIYDHKQSEDIIMDEKKIKEKVENVEVIEKEETNEDLKKVAFQLEEEIKVKDGLLKNIQDKDLELKKLQEFKLEVEKKLEESLIKEKEADLELFTSSLVNEKISSNAMKPLVRALFEEKDLYKINEKEYDKKELIKEILNLSKETAKINFSETTKQSEKVDEQEQSKDEIRKYQKEHNCIYSVAYKAVMKRK